MRRVVSFFRRKSNRGFPFYVVRDAEQRDHLGVARAAPRRAPYELEQIEKQTRALGVARRVVADQAVHERVAQQVARPRARRQGRVRTRRVARVASVRCGLGVGDGGLVRAGARVLSAGCRRRRRRRRLRGDFLALGGALKDARLENLHARVRVLHEDVHRVREQESHAERRIGHIVVRVGVGFGVGGVLVGVVARLLAVLAPLTRLRLSSLRLRVQREVGVRVRVPPVRARASAGGAVLCLARRLRRVSNRRKEGREERVQGLGVAARRAQQRDEPVPVGARAARERAVRGDVSRVSRLTPTADVVNKRALAQRARSSVGI
mmetsp:Transcript_5727/g.23194  ORF Transcript_5727/g.23194 Transcript_5727/m.23194 type:complete len:322 (-) Transcript_5727:327-1292(-)